MRNNLPFDTIGLKDEDIQAFLITLDHLKSGFKAEFDGDFEFGIAGFDVFSNYQSINFKYAIDVSGDLDNSHITFPQIEYKFVGHKGGSHTAIEYQVWGIATLKKDFGHVIIKQETFIDKIIELIHPIELDFEDDKPFNQKFFVVTNDKEKAKLAMNPAFRNAIMEIDVDDFEIEIVNKDLVIGNRKPIDPETAFSFAKFLTKVSSLQ